MQPPGCLQVGGHERPLGRVLLGSGGHIIGFRYLCLIHPRDRQGRNFACPSRKLLPRFVGPGRFDLAEKRIAKGYLNHLALQSGCASGDANRGSVAGQQQMRMVYESYATEAEEGAIFSREDLCTLRLQNDDIVSS